MGAANHNRSGVRRLGERRQPPGTGLSQTATVKFGSVAATNVIVNSDTQVTAVVPAGAVTATIHATTKGGAAVSKTKFTVN
jgi:hypothetical protein